MHHSSTQKTWKQKKGASIWCLSISMNWGTGTSTVLVPHRSRAARTAVSDFRPVAVR